MLDGIQIIAYLLYLFFFRAVPGGLRLIGWWPF